MNNKDFMDETGIVMFGEPIQAKESYIVQSQQSLEEWIELRNKRKEEFDDAKKTIENIDNYIKEHMELENLKVNQFTIDGIIYKTSFSITERVTSTSKDIIDRIVQDYEIKEENLRAIKDKVAKTTEIKSIRFSVKEEVNL